VSKIHLESFEVPLEANSISQGHGRPVVLIHGLSASLHDWDALIPLLVSGGYSAHALDLLGHGDSPKPARRAYQMGWLVDHFAGWLEGLHLSELPVLIGHSLGGYVALEYARRFPGRVRGLVLADPFYAHAQLPAFLRLAYAHPALSSLFLSHAPPWIVRFGIDAMSVMIGHSRGGLHALPEAVREQTALDYLRTAPATYAILEAELDLTPYLPSISVPTLVLWGDRDRTLSPASFEALVRQLPHATGASRRTGHVVHQAEAEWFNEQVLAFLKALEEGHEAATEPPSGSNTTTLRAS
jgi:pimeloyl-ACP methyl ester carboxylesterase